MFRAFTAGVVFWLCLAQAAVASGKANYTLDDVYGDTGIGRNKLDGISSLAVSPKEDIVVADHINDYLNLYGGINTKYIRTIGSPDGIGNVEFDDPVSVAIDRLGRIWVSDGENNRLVVLEKSGQIVSTIGKKGRGAGDFREPGGLAIIPSGRVYVADRKNKRIQVLTNRGFFLEEWTRKKNSVKRRLSFPVDLAYSDEDDGYIWVSQDKSPVLEQFELDGKWAKSLDLEALVGEEVEIVDFAFDLNFHWLFVIDGIKNRILVINARRELDSVIEMPEGSTATAIAVGRMRSLYVGDSEKTRILHYKRR